MAKDRESVSQIGRHNYSQDTKDRIDDVTLTKIQSDPKSLLEFTALSGRGEWETEFLCMRHVSCGVGHQKKEVHRGPQRGRG